jgi:undecaprenyl-diphosphatase
MFPEWDKKVFKLINESHTNTCDVIMQFLSNKYVWIPLYVYLIWKIYKLNSAKFKTALFYLILSIVWADQISSSFFKPFFKRLRPSHVSEFQEWIHLPDGPGGLYGFCSSHAANSFAIAAGMYLLTKNKKMGYVLILWASSIAYSRIYLGVHYPLDVIVGAGVGILGAVMLKRFVYDKLIKN